MGKPLVPHVAGMVAHREEDITGIAVDVQIGALGKEGNTVQGRVSLDVAPVRLCLQHRQNFIQGLEGDVEPGRDDTWSDIEISGAEYQQRADRLGPGGAAFAGNADENVVIADFELVPSCRIDDRSPIDDVSFRQLDVHGNTSQMAF